MAGPRHTPSPQVAAMSLDQIIERYTARFKKIDPDWNAFADSQMEGRKRGQYRFIGAGGSGKHDDPNFIPPGNFTLSIMCLPPGQGGSAHSHECEEAFFVLQGTMTVFLQDEKGNRASTKLGQWECISCPAGVLHGFMNEGDEPVYVQTMVGRGKPGPVGYADDAIYEHEMARIKAPA
jgi:mannose-6-phosphate isomerase-like protein (cupin superfamily)